MKKKTRNITVDGIAYVWAISKYNGDGDWGFALDIWRDGVKFYAEWISGIGSKVITPGIVAQKIKDALK